MRKFIVMMIKNVPFTNTEAYVNGKMLMTRLVGRKYWSGLIKWLKNTVVAVEHLDEEDFNLFTITDDPDEIVELVENQSAHEKAGNQKLRAQD